jgi:hypothetical protein
VARLLQIDLSQTTPASARACCCIERGRLIGLGAARVYGNLRSCGERQRATCMLTIKCPLSLPIGFAQDCDGGERVICATTNLYDLVMARKRQDYEAKTSRLDAGDRHEWPAGSPPPNEILKALFAAYPDVSRTPLDMIYKSDIDFLGRNLRGHGFILGMREALRRLSGEGGAGLVGPEDGQVDLAAFQGACTEWWASTANVGGAHFGQRHATPSVMTGSFRSLGRDIEDISLALFQADDIGSANAALLATSVDPARILDVLAGPPQAIAARFGSAASGRIRVNPAAGQAGFRAGKLIFQARNRGWRGGTAFMLGGAPFLLLEGPHAGPKPGAAGNDAADFPVSGAKKLADVEIVPFGVHVVDIDRPDA